MFVLSLLLVNILSSREINDLQNHILTVCFLYSITLQNVDRKDTGRFWVDIGRNLWEKLTDEDEQIFNDKFFGRKTVSTASELSSAFNEWEFVVIFVDEFDGLYSATDEVLNSFLDYIRTIKHAAKANEDYPILSVVAVGTFGILNLNSSDTYNSPFNVQEPLQNPNLSRETFWGVWIGSKN